MVSMVVGQSVGLAIMKSIVRYLGGDVDFWDHSLVYTLILFPGSRVERDWYKLS